MAISSNRYVDITSSTGGGSVVPERQLVLRLFTTNSALEAGEVLSVPKSGYESVLADLFGVNSVEYKSAAYYFGFVSKVGFSPELIQFDRYSIEGVAPSVDGSASAGYDELALYEDPVEFIVKLNGISYDVQPFDIVGASMNDIASNIQTAIQATGGAMSSATVVYNSGNDSFDMSTAVASDGIISFEQVTSGLLENLGWREDASYNAGSAAGSITETLVDSVARNNNFATYEFIDDLSNDEILESATFADARSFEFIYLQKVTASNKVEIANLLDGLAMTVLTQEDNEDGFAHLLPAAVTASLNYDKPAASANFMYQVDSRLSASVSNDADATINDNLNVNYHGVTQANGGFIAFYQRGVTTDGLQIGIVVNEIWLKSYVERQFLDMFLALPQVPADLAGEAIGRSYLDSAVQKALDNGSVATGKTLTDTQINFIKQITDDDNAYIDVQTRGWWYTLTINPETDEMEYLLVYASRNSVVKVTGNHKLI